MSTTATKFEKAKKVCTVGDGDFMFCMHTQPMKPFQIESMSGADPDILLGGGGVHYLSRKFDTQKQKRKQQQQQRQRQQTRTDREEEVVSAPCTHGPCLASFFEEGKKREET